MTLHEIAAWLFAALCALVVLFQLALAAGAPWGEWAMGGKYPGRFPPALRVAAIIQAGVITLLACVVLARAGVASVAPLAFPDYAFWVAVAFSFVAAVMNGITPSKKERALWAPVTLLMLLCVLAIALA